MGQPFLLGQVVVCRVLGDPGVGADPDTAADRCGIPGERLLVEAKLLGQLGVEPIPAEPVAEPGKPFTHGCLECWSRGREGTSPVQDIDTLWP